MTDHAPSPGPILSIDTSTEQAGIAIWHEERVGSLSWHAGRSHTVRLLDQVHRLLDLAGLEPGGLSAVAVAMGPGAFTGLRVGMSAAKGLCLALDLPVVGVSTLAAAAAGALCPGRPAVAAVAAGRGRLCWAAYERDGAGLPREVSAPVNATPAELAAAIAAMPVPPIVTGELGDAEGLIAGTGAVVVPAALRPRRPEAMLAIALPRIAAGETDDPVTLEPVYLGR
ncbi:MAG: tRNA (adenosine(37)-N6)-threonylcarbamoyltransferase complex dimerization subunit type 1 TsaB [Chloroflexota bacterium]